LLEPFGASADSHIFAVGHSLNNIKINIAAIAIFPTIPILVAPILRISVNLSVLQAQKTPDGAGVLLRRGCD